MVHIDVSKRSQQSLGASSDPVYQMVAKTLAHRHPGGGVLVDIGCGSGKLWSFVGSLSSAYNSLTRN